MAKKCPQCGRSNEDAMHFCVYCSAALDSDVKLLMDLEKRSKASGSSTASRRRNDDEDEFIPPVSRPQKKSSGLLPLLVLAVAVAAVCFFLMR